MYKKLLSEESRNLIFGVKITSLLIQFTFLVFPLSMYIVYNKVIASKNPNTLLIILLFLLTILIIQLVLKITECIQQNILKTDEEISNQKQYITSKLQSDSSNNIISKNDIVELATLSRDADKDIQNHISGAYLIFIAIYLVLILIIGKYIIIIPTCFFGLNYLIACKLSNRQNQHNEKYKKEYSKKNTLIREILLKIKVIKGLNISKNIINRYHDIALRANTEKCYSLYLQNTLLKASMVINIVNIAFILLLGRYLYSIGILNIEQVITCSLMTVWISRPMAQLLMNINNDKRKAPINNNHRNQSNIQNNLSEYNKIKESINNNLITYYKPNTNYNLQSFYHYYITENNKTSYLDDSIKLFYGSIIDNMTMFENSNQDEAISLSKLFKLNQIINNLPYNYNYVTTGEQDEVLPFDLKIGMGIIRELIRKPSLMVIDIDENRLNRNIVSGLAKYAKQYNIKLVCLKSDKNIHQSILDLKNNITKNSVSN